MKKLNFIDPIINLIVRGIELKVINTVDLLKILNFCIGIIEEGVNNAKDFLENFNFAPESRVSETEGKTAIKQYISKFNKDPEFFYIENSMIDKLLACNSNIEVYFSAYNQDLEIAYYNTSSDKYYYLHSMHSFVEMTDFIERKEMFEKNFKPEFDKASSPLGHKTAEKVIIELADLQKFSNFRIGKNRPKAELVLSINNSDDERFKGRVSLLMRFVSESVVENTRTLITYPDFYFDTYTLCPPCK